MAPVIKVLEAERRVEVIRVMAASRRRVVRAVAR